MKIGWFGLFTFLVLKFATASPFPVTGPSLILNPKLNIFLWPYKIDLNLQGSNFEIDLNHGDSDKWTIKGLDKEIQIFARYRKLGEKENFDKSIKNWIREYEKSGFQIKGQQIPRKNAESGWIHLQDSQSEKQLLQYFRYKNHIWVFFNCVGPKEKLEEIKKSCEFLNSTLKFRE
jgi:hypothetical protein